MFIAIVSTPRSGSSLLYRTMKTCLEISDTGISSGEVLNHQRDTSITYTNPKFWTQGNDEEKYQVLSSYYKSDLTYLIKDVVFPHATAKFVDGHSIPTIVLFRSPVQVAFSCWKKGWLYPCDYVKEEKTKLGLLKSIKLVQDNCLRPLVKKPNAHLLTYEDLTDYPIRTHDIISRLGYPIQMVEYRTTKFNVKRAQVKADLESDEYKEFLELYGEL